MPQGLAHRSAGAPRHDALLPAWLVAYALGSALWLALSARLWLQSPLNLVAHEFDFFVGLFRTADEAMNDERVAQGRALHLGLCLLVGLFYVAAVARLARVPDALPLRSIVFFAGGLAVLYALGMPWLSPDVFFYIGTGWLESHYGKSPYLVTINQLPGFAQDEMFANVFPGFVGGTTSYGPLFQKLASVLAGLSAGHEKLALALHKLANLGLHAAASLLVYRLAPARWARPALLSYAANPVILFSVLTCAHNDHWMNVFVLLALLALRHGRWGWCGAALGTAFSFKYFPLVFLPLLLLVAFASRWDGRWAGLWRLHNLAAPAMLALGFAVVAVLSHLMYPESLPQFSRTVSTGVSVYRNSIYHFIDVMSFFVLPLWFDWQAVFLAYGELGRVLRVVYMAVYAVVVLLYLRRFRRDPFGAGVEACLVVTVLYFIVVNATNQEWYLTWLMGFAFVLPQASARALGWRLSVYFLPFVPYTVKAMPSVLLLSNAWLYGVVLLLGGVFLWQTARAGLGRAQP